MNDYDDISDETSTITPDDLSNQTRYIMDHITKTANESTRTVVGSTDALQKEIRAANKKIISLQTEMNEREKSIEELLLMRKHTKNVYYAGLLTGMAGMFIGLFSGFMYVIAGFGVAITACVGLYDAKDDNW